MERPEDHLFKLLLYRNEGNWGLAGIWDWGSGLISGSVGLGVRVSWDLAAVFLPGHSAKFPSLPALSRTCVSEEIKSLFR